MPIILGHILSIAGHSSHSQIGWKTLAFKAKFNLERLAFFARFGYAKGCAALSRSPFGVLHARFLWLQSL